MSEEEMDKEKVFDILTVGHPILRQKAEKVSDLREVGPLCEVMVGTMRASKGVGLAAPQIGKSISIIVVEIPKNELLPNRPVSPLFIMINPEIANFSNEKEYDWESCLSIPGLKGRVPRSRSVTVQYTSLDGCHHENLFDGFLARLIQHECDHLLGIMFLERMESMAEIYSVENWWKFIMKT
jgi:peptide deformylase